MISYDVNDVQFAENEINDPFAQAFVLALKEVYAEYEGMLTEANFDGLIHNSLRHITAQLERAVLQKRFSQLGGLQFDKDLRCIVSYYTGITKRTIRGEFARLLQMASLLNLERVSEVMDYWGENSGQVTWRLTPSEVRKVLGYVAMQSTQRAVY